MVAVREHELVAVREHELVAVREHELVAVREHEWGVGEDMKDQGVGLGGNQKRSDVHAVNNVSRRGKRAPSPGVHSGCNRDPRSSQVRNSKRHLKRNGQNKDPSGCRFRNNDCSERSDLNSDPSRNRLGTTRDFSRIDLNTNRSSSQKDR
ncbi:MAG: hypothetical protein A2X97_09420 [Bdellovibrionales bacterium GWA1_52_35]|nr:MAG: hypothetical protein A2X97_09420 [Bdellovibrionales bacterium GWA1_52_35]